MKKRDNRRSRAGKRLPGLWILGAALLLGPNAVTVSAGRAETRQHIAGPEYGKSGLHTFWWGKAYRDVWTTPIEVEVLDLQKEAGGLEVQFQVGGMQTPGLALKGADGKSYTFRSVKKDLTMILPKAWQQTLLAESVQDQNSANHPGVFPFLNALPEPFPWATQPPQRLVVMPDDPALGEHRAFFAGRLGTFGEYPMPAGDGQPGYMGATEILSSKELWYRWLEDPANRVDTRLFLRYRIADLWTGNWDRHSKQWRWARLPGSDRWRPIAEDPDQVFANYEGLLLSLARGQFPKLVAFKDRISGMEGVTHNGADIDRWLLTDLDKEVFLQEARKMRAELTDEVIDRALKNMPQEWYAVSGPELSERLKKRRDNLEEGVERYYRHLAGEVNVHGTNRDEAARIRRTDDGAVEVTLGLAEEGAEPYYRRRFEPGETRSVRIYLHAGNDRIVSEGPPRRRVKVIVVGGPGNDNLDDSRSGGTKLYDFEGINDIAAGKGTKVDARAWTNPSPSDTNPWLEPRDYGRVTKRESYIWYEPDSGFLLNGGFRRTTWGFRRLPSQTDQRLMLRWATDRKRGGIDYSGTLYRANSTLSASLDLAYSGIESLNFYGFGNGTVKDEELEAANFFQVEENLFRIKPAINWTSPEGLKISFGAEVQYTEETSTDTLIVETSPYGSGKFGQAGLLLDLEWSSREDGGEFVLDLPKAGKGKRENRTGISAGVEGSYFPPLLDVEESFGALEGELAGAIGLGAAQRVVVASRVGGRVVWGDFPWREAAFIGGKESNRGFSSRRFAGDKSAYGSLELRLNILKIKSRLPSRIWIYGLTDAGRVWSDGEDSNEWHPSYGGGVVLELRATPLKLRAEVARNDDEDSLNFYLQTGFAF